MQTTPWPEEDLLDALFGMYLDAIQDGLAEEPEIYEASDGGLLITCLPLPEDIGRQEAVA